jgi:hypothetical protein
VPFQGTQLQARGLDDLDYRYEFWAFAPADHFALAIHDSYAPAAAFLDDARVDRNPAHVTYVRNPKMDFPEAGTVADHAYWLSGVELADATGAAPFGTIDVVSEGFGVGDPAATGTLADGGTLTGGNVPTGIAYQRQRKEWGDAPRAATRNRLVVNASNVGTVTIDPVRARVDCGADIAVVSDSPIVVRLAGCRGARTFAQSADCGARGLPRSSLARHGLRATRRRGIAISGRAIAFRCVANRRRVGAVARVEVAVARKSGRKCRYLTRAGRLGKARSCARNEWLRARLGRQRAGKVPWTFRSGARLPRGVYELRVRAIDRTGAVERQPRKQGRKTIRVR